MVTSLGIIPLFQKQFFVLGCCLSFIVLMAKISHKLLSRFFFGGGGLPESKEGKNNSITYQFDVEL